jgi:ubiquinone/menaquinone biosynthesis C-methylase UbiE
MNRRIFHKIYWRLEPIIAPALKDSQSIYEEVLTEHSVKSVRWLDLGCGHHLLPPWRFEQEQMLISKVQFLVGIDYDYLSLTKHATIKNKIRGDITRLPFPDNTFDLITSNMVFEHLSNPQEQLREISRVLSKGGKLIFHTPNNLSYSTLMARIIPDSIKNKLVYLFEGRKEEDVFPAYYRINHPSRIRQYAEMTGFNIVRIKLLCSSAKFIILPPIVLIELLWIRFLMTKVGKPLRTNIIAILEKR